MSNYFIIGLILIFSIVLPIDASVRICNDGAYIAKCYLQSRTSNYGYQIRRIDTGLFPVAQCRTMDIPIEAVLNRLECKELAFIAVYKNIFTQEFASASYNYCYRITGTTLDPRWSQTQC